MSSATFLPKAGRQCVNPSQSQGSTKRPKSQSKPQSGYALLKLPLFSMSGSKSSKENHAISVWIKRQNRKEKESNRNRKEELGQGRISRENKRPRHGYHGFVPPLTTRKFFFPLLLILQLFLLFLLAKSFTHLLSQDIIFFVLTLCRSPGQLKVRGYKPLCGFQLIKSCVTTSWKKTSSPITGEANMAMF